MGTHLLHVSNRTRHHEGLHKELPGERLHPPVAVAGRSAYPGWSAYCATKAALDQHARAVALDHDINLRICSLAPGVIDTGMQAEIRGLSLEQFPMREKFDDLKRAGALSDPAQCARHVVGYLLGAQFGSVPVDDLRSGAATNN